MRRIIILLAVVALVTQSLAEEETEKKEEKKEEQTDEKKYTDRFDDINIEEIIANRRLLVPYLKCVLDKGRCTPEGKELKAHVKDAMQTACEKCTDKQKTGARKVVNHIRDNEKEYWEELINKYDPKGEFKTIYEPFLAAKE
ncbi:allergen Tha p 1-like [Ostrinia furnacalis]|uniref:allergen Tha p 1-like n=1 Tax=Ostrinia furnacalis TaxID=93504 RepID=UPI001039E8FF|nr:allergen Tha p 1-like [Ostrinia furnacalis]